ncbi:MAG: hypothetical protein LIP03_04605 [Bacteroidales bacterium]|nr:hypothetical protein [Bacteroidales bacterium]
MRAKQITLTAMLTMTMAAYALEAMPQANISISEMRPVGQVHEFSLVKETKALPTFTKQKPAAKAQLLAMKAEANTPLLLDSIVVSLPEENNNLYSKTYYEYDENNYPIYAAKYSLSYGSAPILTEENGYKWNDQGYCLEKYTIVQGPYGEKYEYQLNADNYMTKLTFLITEDGETWQARSASEYEYNAMNLPTLHIDYGYNYDTQELYAYRKEYAEYDEMGRMTQFTEYSLEDGEFVPVRELYTYYQDTDLLESKTEQRPLGTEQVLTNYGKRIYSYNATTLALESEYIVYWNIEKEDWSGGSIWGDDVAEQYNSRILYTYDEQGRLIDELTQLQQVPDQWTTAMEVVTTYEDEEDGAYTYIQTQQYPYGNEMEDYFQIIEHHLAWGGVDYSAWKTNNNGHMEFMYECTVTYNEANQELVVSQWNYYNNVRYPAYKVEYTYDDTPEEWSSFIMYYGDLVLGEDVWTPDEKVERTLENGAITAYIDSYWENYEWYTYSGNWVDYDFSIGPDEFVAWTETFDFLPIQEREMRWGTMYATDYYFSRHAMDSVTSVITSAKEISAIYSISGTKLQGRTLNGLASGVYVVVYTDGTAQKKAVK